MVLSDSHHENDEFSANIQARAAFKPLLKCPICARTSQIVTAETFSLFILRSSLFLLHFQPYIVNYFKKRKNSGFVEGMNNKIKVAKRRCYGFSAVKTIFQRLFLDFQGFEIYA